MKEQQQVKSEHSASSTRCARYPPASSGLPASPLPGRLEAGSACSPMPSTMAASAGAIGTKNQPNVPFEAMCAACRGEYSYHAQQPCVAGLTGGQGHTLVAVTAGAPSWLPPQPPVVPSCWVALPPTCKQNRAERSPCSFVATAHFNTAQVKYSRRVMPGRIQLPPCRASDVYTPLTCADCITPLTCAVHPPPPSCPPWP